MEFHTFTAIGEELNSLRARVAALEPTPEPEPEPIPEPTPEPASEVPDETPEVS